jgi:hypothetical protein
MKLTLVHQPSLPASASPYRLLDEQGQEVAWTNAFLDAQRIRQLSIRSLRAYAYDLLHFARWFQHSPRPLSDVSESTLLDYVRHQLDQQPKPAPQTVNHRLGVVRCLYRFHYGREIPPGQSHFQRIYTKRSSLGYGRPRRAAALGLRLRQPPVPTSEFPPVASATPASDCLAPAFPGASTTSQPRAKCGVIFAHRATSTFPPGLHWSSC